MVLSQYFPEGLRKSMKSLRIVGCASQDLNGAPPEFRYTLLPLGAKTYHLNNQHIVV
jgi:hypothetical protein